MKKLLLVLLALMVLGAAGSAAWWKYGRRPDHLALGRAAMTAGDMRTAALELRTAVRDNPDSIEARYRLGHTLLQLGDAVAAQKELEQARSMGGGQPDIPVLLAQSYLLQGQNKDLLEKFKPPMANKELTSQLLVIRALALNTLGDPQAAMSALDDAAIVTPQSASVPMTAARIAQMQNNLPLAMAKVEAALSIDPKRVDALLIKAQILVARGNRQAAQDVLDTALSAVPRYTAARLERANLELDLSKDDDARRDVDEVLKAQPNSAAGTYLNAVLLTRAKKSAQADMEFQKISVMLDRFPRAYLFLGLVKLDLGQMQQALDAATRYNARHPGDPDGVKLLAGVLLATKHADQAVVLLTKAQSAGMADSDLLSLLSQAYVAAGKPNEAVLTLERANQIAPQTRKPIGLAGSADFTGALVLTPDMVGTDTLAIINALKAGDLETADAALKSLRIQQGDSEVVGLLSAGLMTLRQEYDGARKQYEQLIATNPKAVWPHIGLAQVAMIQGQNDIAERTLTDILAHDPSDEHALRVLLPMLTGTGRNKQAIAILEAAAQATPDNANYGLTLVQLYINTSAPEKALSVLERMQPRTGEAPVLQQVARAHVLAGLHRTSEAIEIYRHLLISLPGDLALTGELMALQQAGHDYDGAAATVQASLKSKPSDLSLLRLLVGNAALAGGQAEAELVLSRLDGEPATHAQVQIMRGDLAMIANHFGDAAGFYAAQMKETPNSALALASANAFSKAGDPRQALLVIDAWLAQSPKDVTALRMQADLRTSLDDRNGAVQSLENLIKLRQDDAAALNNLAWLYAERNDSQALKLARRAFTLQPSAQSADTLGWVLLRTGQPGASLPILTQAAATLKDDPTVQYHYGVALARNGRQGEALVVLRALAERETPFPEREDARRLAQELRTAK